MLLRIEILFAQFKRSRCPECLLPSSSSPLALAQHWRPAQPEAVLVEVAHGGAVSPGGATGINGSRALSPGTMAPQPNAPGTSPAVATPPTVAPPNSPLAPTPASPAPTLPNPPNPMQPVNPALNPSTQRVPEIGNPTPQIGAPQYQEPVPPLQSQTVGGPDRVHPKARSRPHRPVTTIGAWLCGPPKRRAASSRGGIGRLRVGGRPENGSGGSPR